MAVRVFCFAFGFGYVRARARVLAACTAPWLIMPFPRKLAFPRLNRAQLTRNTSNHLRIIISQIFDALPPPAHEDLVHRR